MSSDQNKTLDEIGYTESQMEEIGNAESQEGVHMSGVSGTVEKELGLKILSSIRSALVAKPGKNAAFREWLLNLRPGDQAPRGRYFKNRRKLKSLIIYDEPMEFRYYN